MSARSNSLFSESADYTTGHAEGEAWARKRGLLNDMHSLLGYVEELDSIPGETAEAFANRLYEAVNKHALSMRTQPIPPFFGRAHGPVTDLRMQGFIDGVASMFNSSPGFAKAMVGHMQGGAV